MCVFVYLLNIVCVYNKCVIVYVYLCMFCVSVSAIICINKKVCVW